MLIRHFFLVCVDLWVGVFRWKDRDNVFRKHPDLELTGVPTLMQWGTVSDL